MIKLSIISTSRGNREVDFIKLLDSVSKIKNKCFVEFVFFDQSSGVCKKLIDKFDIDNVKYTNGTLCSLSFARNECLKQVTGNYICFADDDAIYDSDIYNNLAKIVNDFGKHVYIGTVINESTGKGYGRRNYKDEYFSTLTFEEMINLGLSLSLYLPFLPEMKFDESLGAGAKYGGSEETDFLLRYKKRVLVYYTSVLNVEHPDEDATNVSFKKYYNYSIGYSLVMLRAFNNNKLGVTKVMSRLILRTLGGILLSNNRKIYLSRILGLIMGAIIYVKERVCS
jgi:glycosyltransferase involved in cell wall biosynthesis